MDEDHEIVRKSVEAYRTVFGEEPVVDKWTFSTNGVATAGMFGIPTIGFGPGNEIHAHSPNVRLSSIKIISGLMIKEG